VAGSGDDLIRTARACAAVACGALLAIGVGGVPASAAPSQWYLDKAGVPAAHTVARGDGVTIAMFTDVAAIGNDELTDDPDLVGQFVPGATFADGKRTDERPEGDPDDAFVASEPLTVSTGRSGLVGVAPGAKLLPVAGDIFGGDQIRWMVDNGAKVINYYRNTSAVNIDTTDAEAEALRYALSKDVVVVVDAASAEGGPDVPGLVVVGATDRDDRRVSDPRESGERRVPALMAPFVQQTEPAENQTSRWDYRPMYPQQSAAAIVAGVAALIRSKYPELNAASVVNRLVRTARDLGPSGRDDEFGNGLVDAAAALRSDIEPVTRNPLGEPERSDGRSRVVFVAAAVVGVLLLGGMLAIVVARRRRAA
jgi:subtilisin family serine protease